MDPSSIKLISYRPNGKRWDDLPRPPRAALILEEDFNKLHFFPIAETGFSYEAFQPIRSRFYRSYLEIGSDVVQFDIASFYKRDASTVKAILDAVVVPRSGGLIEHAICRAAMRTYSGYLMPYLTDLVSKAHNIDYEFNPDAINVFLRTRVNDFLVETGLLVFCTKERIGCRECKKKFNPISEAADSDASLKSFVEKTVS